MKFNKPVYVGMYILEISKIRLYKFYYDYKIPLYREKCNSLNYLLECDNAYKNMKHDIERFDTSN